MKRKLVVLLMSEGSSLVDLFFESDLAQQVARHYGCHGGTGKDVN